jgi:hypothetical protein
VSAVLQAVGRPEDADRLGVGAGDVAAAAALALVCGALAAAWAADAATRVLCARVGAYLHLRARIDGVPTDVVRTAPPAAARLDAEAAGFVEVSRVAPAGPSRGAR